MNQILILGGGFAGINLALTLGKNRHNHITLVDKNNYNFFPPLIYQVAAGFISASDISYPFRKLFNRHPNIRFRQGTVQHINPEKQTVTLDNGELSYQTLIIALGSQPNYFGNQQLSRYAYTMKTIGDALAIRNKFLSQLETACTLSGAARDPYLNLVVAGGGASGVELTGILAEMRRDIFAKDYPELEGAKGQLLLITADPVLLPPMREKSRQYTADTLEKLGAQIIYSDPVTDYDGNTITLKSGKTITAKSLIWTAGVTVDRIAGIPESCYARGNRLRTDRQLRLIGLNNIYALGDCAAVEGDESYPHGHPQLGQVAMAQGKYLGKHLGKKNKPFIYKHRGDMAMIGRLSAVADMPGGRCLNGTTAWIIWVVVHILSLITFRNRIATTYNWLIAFITKNQAMRMNVSPTPPENEHRELG